MDVLLERELELDQIGGLIDATARGQGYAVAVEGPPGIGKTSLAAEARRRAEGAELHTLAARGAEIERDFSFGVVLSLLDPLVRRGDPATLFAGAADFARPLFDADFDPRGDPDSATLYGLYWLVAALAEPRPLLLVIDDLQWADRPTLRFLGFLARRLDGLAVGLLVATREDVPEAHRGLLADLAAEFAAVLRPRPLSASATLRFVHDRLGAADPRVAGVCHRITGGVPFYLDAVLDELSRTTGPVTPESIERLIPRTVSLALLRRFGLLPEEAREVAAAVAVLGDGAAAVEVAELTCVPLQDVEDLLSALQKAGIVDGLAFTHPVIRTSVYGDLERRRREQLHARAAELRRAAGRPADVVAAQVLRAAPGTVPGATEVLEEAARIALARGAPDTAAGYLQRALAEASEPRRRAGLARALGAASVRAGLPEAEDHLRHALELAQDGETHAAVALDLVRLKTLAGQSAVDGVDELTRCVRERSDLSAAAIDRIHAEIVAIGDMDISVRAHAVAAATELQADLDPADPTVAAMLLAHRATDAVMRCAPATDAAELARRALAGGALVGAGLSGIQQSFLAAYFLMCADRFDEAERFFEQVIAAARGTGSAAGFSSASAWHSFVAFRRGRLADAAAEARSAIDVAEASGLRLVHATALMNLCWALVDRDRAGEAAAHLAEAAFEPEDLSFFVGATTLDARGRVRIALSDLEGGVADLRESGRRITECGLDNPACFPWRSGIAGALATLGRAEEALALAHEELTLARRWAAPRAVGIALQTLGTIGPAPLECFAEAVEVLAGSPALLQRARALIDYGSALRHSGRNLDARPLLREGLELAVECGAPGDAARARSELRAAGSRARVPDRSGLDALTPSEHRIAWLAAQGRSNPEIAQDLFVTRKTVEMHLSGAYRKLGIRSRGELPNALEPRRSGSG